MDSFDTMIEVYSVLGVLNLPIFLIIRRYTLGDWHGFFDSVKYYNVPHWFSVFTLSYWRRALTEDDLWVLLLLYLSVVALEAMFVLLVLTLVDAA